MGIDYIVVSNTNLTVFDKENPDRYLKYAWEKLSLGIYYTR
jgi:hypothetical protein